MGTSWEKVIKVFLANALVRRAAIIQPKLVISLTRNNDDAKFMSSIQCSVFQPSNRTISCIQVYSILFNGIL